MLSGGTMILTIPTPDGRGTRSLPVDFLREGDVVYCGSDFSWWPVLVGGAPVKVFIRGRELSGRADAIQGDPVRTEAGFRKLRPRTHRRALRTGAVLIEIRLTDGPA